MIRDYVYFMLILIIALALTISRAANADALSDCKETLQVCDAVVDLLHKSNEGLTKQIDLQSEYIEELKKHVKANDSLLPPWGWAIVGMGVGVITWEAVR